MYGIKFCGETPFWIYYDNQGLHTSGHPTIECIWDEASIDAFLYNKNTDPRYKKTKLKLVEDNN